MTHNYSGAALLIVYITIAQTLTRSSLHSILHQPIITLLSHPLQNQTQNDP